MKQRLHLFCLALLAFACCQVGQAQRLWRIYTQSDSTMTLAYLDEAPTEWNGLSVDYAMVYDATIDSDADEAYKAGVVRVEIDSSVVNWHPTSLEGFFANYEVLREINGLPLLNTSEVTNMCRMFFRCYRLGTYLDLTSFNTANVTTMEDMFFGCTYLRGLDLSSFDTRRVKSMGAMFAYCYRLREFYADNFHGDSLTDVSSMFFRCVSLDYVYLPSLKLNSTVNFNNMFDGCRSLYYLELGGADGRAFEEMRLNDPTDGGYYKNYEAVRAMFRGTAQLAYINFSSFTNFSDSTLYYMLEGSDARTLKYLPSGSTLTGENTIVDGVCSSYVVEDGRATEIAKSFKANTTRYHRDATLRGKTSTWYLPYDVHVPSGYQAYSFLEVDTTVSTSVIAGTAVFVPSTDSVLRAYTPYLMVPTTATIDSLNDWIIQTDEVIVPQMGDEGVGEPNQWYFHGSLSKYIPSYIWHVNRGRTRPYALNDDTKEWEVQYQALPLRAMIYYTEQTLNRDLSLTTTLSDLPASIQNIELLDTANRGISRIYDLNGRYLGTRREVLRSGIYVIDGKKVSLP